MMCRLSGLSAASLLLLALAARAEDLPPKPLFDPAAPGAAELIVANGKDTGVTWAVKDGGIDVTVPADCKSSFPGILIPAKPAWNAQGYGHIEAKITNTGDKPLRISLRIDNEGPWQDEPYSAGSVLVKPGQATTVSAIFGYKWGKKDYLLHPEAIKQAIIFGGKAPEARSFRIEAIRAAGPAGEKPSIDPATVAARPDGGVLIGAKAKFDPAKQLVARGGAKISASDSSSFGATFTGAGEQSVLIKPAIGMWNLSDHLQVRARVKNTGPSAITPALRLESRGGNSDVIPAAAAIEPGAEGEIIASFAAQRPWQGADLPEMLQGDGPARDFKECVPGTGTRYTSNTTTGTSLLADKAGSVQVTSLTAEMPARTPLPDWLGKRPPVEGDWTQTFDDNFDGTAIDLRKWNLYSEGEWHLGKATAWSKDNVIVKDGKLLLRVEKRKAHHNDDPKMQLHDYATGNCDTMGKWTQRYGYFESRLKMPAAPNAFTAFWMMPDRGLEYAADPKKVAFGETRHFRRDSTNGNGMEFDIMEQLSIWGPNRHDFGFHWDFYQKNHKSTGTLGAYVQPDAEGFITVGMLWTPGSIVIYQQGREAGRWECKRVSQVPSYFILQHITGGWETEGMDDDKLPMDMVFDYVRAWQRKDLASDVDGPKPNDAGPRPPKLPEVQN